MAEPAVGGDKQQRRLAMVVLVLATVIYAVTLPFAAMAALMMPMAFDSGESPVAWAYLGAAICYPLLVVVTLIACWVLFGRQRYRGAMIVLLLPLLGTPLAAGIAALTHAR